MMVKPCADDTLSGRLARIKGRIQAAATAAARDPATIQLLAVSKKKSAADIRAACQAGVNCIGENYVAEATAKMSELADLSICWHFIGAVQSNKTATLATHFDWIQSLDRFKIARRLSEQRPLHLAPLNLCVQINLDRERQKAGVNPEDAFALCRQIATLPRLRLRGLMAIPKLSPDRQVQHRSFSALSELQLELADKLQLPDFDTLSAGTSADFETAIACGSTLIRVGTALFGPRS